MSTSRLAEVSGAVARIWSGGRRVERIAYVVGAMLFASGMAHAGFLLVTGGSWEGPLSLRKPATFGLSFGLTLATVAWVSSMLVLRNGLRRLLLGAFTVTCVIEVSLVSMQAWRGVPSHFNFETPFDNAVAMVLAAGGGLIILTMFGFAVATVVGTDPLPRVMREAVRFGFLSLLAALASGAIMIATGVAEARGGDPELAYATGGWLKPLHAVTMHGVLVLPALAWLLGFTGWSERGQRWLLRIGILAYAVLIAVVGTESFSGVSPLAAGPVETALSAGSLLVLLAVGTSAAVGASRSASRLLRTTVEDCSGRGLITSRSGTNVGRVDHD